MTRIFVIPKKNLIVPDETGTPIPEDGLMVEDNRYWQRRAKEGDIEIGKAPKPTPKKKD